MHSSSTQQFWYAANDIASRQYRYMYRTVVGISDLMLCYQNSKSLPENAIYARNVLNAITTIATNNKWRSRIYALSKVYLYKFFASPCIRCAELLTVKCVQRQQWLRRQRNQRQQRCLHSVRFACNKLRLWATYWFTTVFSVYFWWQRCSKVQREPIGWDEAKKTSAVYNVHSPNIH